MTFQWITEKISQIPAEFWGAITGATIALAGTWLSNRSSRQHLKIQLEAGAKESEKQRLYELKKALILECQLAMTKARRSLCTSSTGDLPKYPEVDDALEKLSLLELTAGDETVGIAIQLKAIYSTAVVDLMRIATPLVSCSSRLNSTRLFHADISKLIKKTIDELQNIDRTRTEGIQQFTQLSRRLDIYKERSAGVEDDIAKLNKEFDQIYSAYHAEMEPIIDTIPHTELSLIAAFRKELGLPPQMYLTRHCPAQQPDPIKTSPASPPLAVEQSPHTPDSTPPAPPTGPVPTPPYR